MEQKKYLTIKLFFSHWMQDGKPMAGAELEKDLAEGDLHAGSIFDGDLHLTDAQFNEMKEMLKKGSQPEFVACINLIKV